MEYALPHALCCTTFATGYKMARQACWHGMALSGRLVGCIRMTKVTVKVKQSVYFIMGPTNLKPGGPFSLNLLSFTTRGQSSMFGPLPAIFLQEK